MIKVKFAAVVTAAITAMSIGSAQARPLPQTGVAISTSQIKSNEPLPPINPFRVTNAATIQLAAGRARVFRSRPRRPSCLLLMRRHRPLSCVAGSRRSPT